MVMFCHQGVVQQHFKAYVSHGSTAKFLRGRRKYYIYFVDNSLLFPAVKEFSFQNWLTVDEVIAKSSSSRFLNCSVYWYGI